MTVRVPANCSSITLTTSGVLVPVGRLITGTPAEETALCTNIRNTSQIVSTNITNGQVQLRLPTVITSITINSVVYAVTAGLTPATIPGADATAFMGATFNQPFELVTG